MTGARIPCCEHCAYPSPEGHAIPCPRCALRYRHGGPDPRPLDERDPSTPASRALGGLLAGIAFWGVILGGILFAGWWAA